MGYVYIKQKNKKAFFSKIFKNFEVFLKDIMVLIAAQQSSTKVLAAMGSGGSSHGTGCRLVTVSGSKGGRVRR